LCGSGLILQADIPALPGEVRRIDRELFDPPLNGVVIATRRDESQIPQRASHALRRCDRSAQLLVIPAPRPPPIRSYLLSREVTRVDAKCTDASFQFLTAVTILIEIEQFQGSFDA